MTLSPKKPANRTRRSAKNVPTRPKDASEKEVNKSAIITMGMHRSGTSAFTGMLDLLGCTTPLSQIPSSSKNPKGFFEAKQIALFNDRILKSAGSVWHDWAEFNTDSIDKLKAQKLVVEAQNILEEEFGKSNLIALKDPRICRIAPFWLRVLEESGYAVFPILLHRNPLDVAQSLLTRNKIRPEVGILLWLRHVLDAETSTRGYTRTFSSYALLLESWKSQANKVKQVFGPHFPEVSDGVTLKVDNFLSSDFQHHESTPEQLIENTQYSPWVRSTFDIMENWAKYGEDTKDHKTLDNIRMAFNAASPGFLSFFLSRDVEFKKTDDALMHAQANAKNYQVNTDTLKKQLAELNNKLDVSKKEIEVVKVATSITQTTLSQAEASLHESHDKIKRVTKHAQKLKSQLIERTVEVETLTARIIGLATQIEKQQSNYDSIVEKHYVMVQTQTVQIRELGEMGRVVNEAMVLAESRQHAAEQAKAEIHKKAEEAEAKTLEKAKKMDNELKALQEELIQVRKKAETKALEKAKKMDNELKILRGKLIQARKEAETAAHNFTSVLDSTSWRISAPIRVFGRALKLRK